MASNTLLPIQLRDLGKNILVAGKGGAVARRAIMEHLHVRHVQAGGGCLYIDTRGDASALLTMRTAMARLGKQNGEFRHFDLSMPTPLATIHTELPTLMAADQSAYLWMPLDRMRARSGEAIARVAAGLHSGFALRHEQLFHQKGAGPVYLIADASDDSSRVFWDLCEKGKASRGANCGLATCLPTLGLAHSQVQENAAEILESAFTKVEVVDGEGEDPSRWRVRISHDDRHQETRYPGFVLSGPAATRDHVPPGKTGWFRSLIGS